MRNWTDKILFSWNKAARQLSLLLAAVFLCMAAGCSGEAQSETLTILCGDPVMGMLLHSDSFPGQTIVDSDYMEFADCCGSSAQFAVSTGEVGVAFLCPDAAEIVMQEDESYQLVGSVLAGSNILVFGDSVTDPQKIGYMNRRTEQETALREQYGDDVELIPMFPSALGYALENTAIDSAVMDLIAAAKLQKNNMRTLGEDLVSVVLIAKQELLSETVFQDFLNQYNEAVSNLSSDELASLLQKELNFDTQEEAAEIWNKTNVQFLPVKVENP